MPKAYVDSSVWITRFEGIPVYYQKVKDTLLNFENEGWYFCYSDLVLLEVLLKPFKENQEFLLESYKRAFETSLFLPNYDELLKQALLIAKSDNLKSIDAIHVAFAVEYNCELFVTTDPHFRTLQSLPLHIIDLSHVSP